MRASAALCARARRKKGKNSNKNAKMPLIESPPPANSGGSLRLLLEKIAPPQFAAVVRLFFHMRLSGWALLWCCWHAKAHIHQECARMQSRQARKIIATRVVAVAKKHGYELPAGCPLHSNNDCYLEQEAHKRELRKNVWKCEHCGKQFRTEFYIDRHMDNKHADKLNEVRCRTRHPFEVTHC